MNTQIKSIIPKMNIMKKISLALALCCASFYSMADQLPLGGFGYGPVEAPTGKEWESPENLALNKEQPHAYIFPFQDVESARKVLPENSKFWQSLDGNWKFNWAPDPDSRPKDFYKTEFDVSGWDNIPVPSSWNIYGVQKDGSLKYGVPIYVNQPVIFQHKVAVDDWRGGVMRTPPTNWTTYKHRNEVGSFRRDFEIPQDWDGREVFISFDGVDSFFYLWINGRYVGFSKNSRNTANFNITPYLRKGTNVVAAEVYRSSDGSFLEAQDMFRLPYAEESFDVVIVSNALHIVPQPEKALQEIKRVLKDDGVLIAPTFTHAGNSFTGKVRAFFMKLAGFPLHSRWTSEEYLRFLRQNGWAVRKSAVLKASFPLTYAECVKSEA